MRLSALTLALNRLGRGGGGPGGPPAGFTPFSDDFNRADGALGVSTSGHAWTVQVGTPTVVTNRYEGGDSGNQIATVELASADFNAFEADLLQSLSDIFNLFRWVDNSNFLIAGFNAASSTDLELYKMVATTFTQLGVYAAGVRGRVRVKAIGDALEVFLAGVSRLSVTEAAHQTATKIGFWGQGTADNAECLT